VGFSFKAFIQFQGKYVEIQFSRGGEPVGGKISNFLLEKVNINHPLDFYLKYGSSLKSVSK